MRLWDLAKGEAMRDFTGKTCEQNFGLSIVCGQPAIALVRRRNGEAQFLCAAHADHDCSHEDATGYVSVLLDTTSEILKHRYGRNENQ